MKKQFLAGVRAAIPVSLGVIPVGMSFGLMAVRAGLSSIRAILMSTLVVAGSSQLMAVGMLMQNVAMATIIIGTFFINLRHIVMSSSVMSRLRETSIPAKLLGAFVLCDESFALFSLSEQASYGFLLGTNAVLFGAWVVSSAVGCFITSFLPQVVANSFGIAFYASFLGLLIPNLRKSAKLALLVCGTALVNALLQQCLPASWSVIVSMVLCAAGGTFLFEEDAA